MQMLFQLKVAWVGLFTQYKSGVCCSKPSLHSYWRKSSMAFKNTFSSVQAPLERVMSASKVGACSKEESFIICLLCTLLWWRVGITEPNYGSSPPGSRMSELHQRSPALACILKTCNMQTPLGTSVLPTASLCAVRNVKLEAHWENASTDSDSFWLSL